MLRYRNKFLKIIASILILITCTFAVPNFSQADFGGKLFSPIVNLFAGIGDVVIGALQKWMLGTSSIWSATLEWDDPNVKIATDEEGNSVSQTQVTVAGKTLERGWTSLDGKYDDINVPNIIYSPELIFSNLVPALDINFLNPDDSRFIQVDSTGEVPVSTGTALHEVVAAWYTAFRNIALVGLLCVLVYVGIRIVISSSAGEKSQYKERIMDWLVALCLLFVMQYIMSFTINITDQITKIFAGSQTIDVYVQNVKILQTADSTTQEELENQNENADFAFTTNLMGYMRFMVYSGDLLEKTSYLIIYLVLVVYTAMFTFIYLKRVLYMAFFTMIAPLVALTYPLDKLSDGKAQAFNLWLREYIFNALIQPMHLALYTMLMTSSMHLATTNPIYALVAIGFLFPAEKFIKKMFGFDKSQTAGGAGSFAGGAMTMALLNRMRSKAHKGGGADSGDDSGGDYIDRGVDASAFRTTNTPPPLAGGVTQTSNGNAGGNGTQQFNGTGNAGTQGSSVLLGGNYQGSANNAQGSANNQQTGTPQNVNAQGQPISSAQQNQANITPQQSQLSPIRRRQNLTPADRRKMRRSYMLNSATRKIKNMPKSAGKFALNTGVRGLKGLAGAALAAIPAGVTLLASGGDFSSAAKIVGAGAGVAAMMGPSGTDMVDKAKTAKENVKVAGMTYSEQKEYKAEQKAKKIIDNKQEMDKLQNLLIKDGKTDISAEQWVKQNQDSIKEYYKNGTKNLDTMYKAESLAEAAQQNGTPISNDYKINIAKQYDNIGKRINNAEYMNAFEQAMKNQGLSQQDYNNLYNNLRFMDDY